MNNLSVRKLTSLLLVALVVGLSGCIAKSAYQAIPIESEESNLNAKNATQPIDGKAVVYIIKNQEWLSDVGAAAYTSVGINSKLVGKLSVNSYFRLTLEPGSHTLVGFHSVPESRRNPEVPSLIFPMGVPVSFLFESGKTYFVRVELGGRWIGHPVAAFSLISHEEGIALLAEQQRRELAKQKTGQTSGYSGSNLVEDVLGILLIGFLVIGIAASGYHASAPPAPNYAMMNLQQTMISRPATPPATADNYSFKSAPYSFKEGPYSFDPSKTSTQKTPAAQPQRQNPMETTTYYAKNGVDWKVNGNTITNTNGDRYRLEGESIYSQTGKRYRIDGSNIIGEDGTRCKVIANTVSCD